MVSLTYMGKAEKNPSYEKATACSTSLTSALWLKFEAAGQEFKAFSSSGGGFLRNACQKPLSEHRPEKKTTNIGCFWEVNGGFI